MPTTNRPFFANFFAAFRIQPAFQKGTPAITSTASTSAPFTTSAPTGAAPTSSKIQAQAELSDSTDIALNLPNSTARQKSAHSNTATASAATVATAAAAASAAAQTHFRSSRPLHVPNGTPQNRTHSTSPLPPSRTPSQTRTSATSPPPQTSGPNPQFPYSPPYSAQTRHRRGSDTSDSSASAGAGGGGGGMWAGAVSPDKWYIGGRTAAGEEKFYKLGLVRKYDSADRLSLDRLSL